MYHKMGIKGTVLVVVMVITVVCCVHQRQQPERNSHHRRQDHARRYSSQTRSQHDGHRIYHAKSSRYSDHRNYFRGYGYRYHIRKVIRYLIECCNIQAKF